MEKVQLEWVLQQVLQHVDSVEKLLIEVEI